MAVKKTDLQRALDALVEKETKFSVFWRYYDGRAPLVYSTEKLYEIFASLKARFSENWAAVVVDSVLDRLSLQKPSIIDDEVLSERVSNLWEASGVWLDEVSVYEDVCITGEGFIIAWPNEETDVIEAFHNDSRRVHIQYDTANPRKKLFACKWWREDEDEAKNTKVFLTMYYEDRLEYYSCESGDPTVHTKFHKDREEINPFGKIPVFHYRSGAREPRSQLVNVVEIQDAINKLLNDMMIAAEFGAAPQRYVITTANLAQLKNAPNLIWKIPPAAPGDQATSVGQFSSTDLGNYLNAIARLASDIGIITKTPKHYLLGGDAPSGEALRVMESPLVKKVERIAYLGLVPAWKDLVQFMLSLDGVEIELSKIHVDFDPFESQQDVLTSQLRKMDRESGLPLTTVLKREGWSENELEGLKTDQQEEQAEQMAFAQAAMASQQRQFDSGEGV